MRRSEQLCEPVIADGAEAALARAAKANRIAATAGHSAQQQREDQPYVVSFHTPKPQRCQAYPFFSLLKTIACTCLHPLPLLSLSALMRHVARDTDTRTIDLASERHSCVLLEGCLHAGEDRRELTRRMTAIG